jgi:hypothetical protein
MLPRMCPDTVALVYSSSWCDPSFKPHAILRHIGVFAGPVLTCGVWTSVRFDCAAEWDGLGWACDRGDRKNIVDTHGTLLVFECPATPYTVGMRKSIEIDVYA